MKLALVGVGNAGSRIANRILDVEAATGRTLTNGNTLLVNATPPTFHGDEHIPTERRLIIGDVHQDVEGQPVDGDPDRMAAVAREEHNEILRAFDLLEFHRVDAVLVIAGLAGGTGGGAGAVVIDQLQTICDDPVYALGVLPGRSEGEDRALTAARSIQSFVDRADNVIVLDNDAWYEDGSATDEKPRPADAYAEVNATIAERVVTLFADGSVATASAPETRMDPSDVMRTLDTGGLSSIGFAVTEVDQQRWYHDWFRGLHDRLPWTVDREADDGDEPTAAAKINQLVRQAARSKLTLPCDISSADRALVLLSGPPSALSRAGFESGRYWLEDEADIVDVMAGDVPHSRSSTLTTLVLFSNVTDVPRIDTMQAQAVGGETSPTAGETEFGTTTQ